MKEGWSKCNQVHEKIWNSKSGTRTYFDFEIKFGALFKVNFGQTIYRFEAREVKSPTLQMMDKLKLKQGSYVHLKQTRQRRILSLKLTTWIQNDFWPFKTQRNARILVTETKFESPYLFQIRHVFRTQRHGGPFKTQRNARILATEAKLESSYLFWITNMHFEPKNMVNMHGQWVSSEFTMNVWMPPFFFTEVPFRNPSSLHSY